MTQAQVGKMTGVKHATVNRHENGNRGLDGFAIERYAKLFGVSPYELFVKPDHEVEYDDGELTPPIKIVETRTLEPAR